MCFAFLSIILLVSAVAVNCSAQESEKTAQSIQNTQPSKNATDYIDYIDNIETESLASQSYIKSASQYSAVYPSEAFECISLYEGRKNAVLCEKKAERLDYIFDITESGFYSLKIAFYPLNLDSKKEEFSLLINDKVPFSQAESLFLNYTFVPEKDNWITNDSGDEYAPSRVINQKWTDCVITNPDHDNDGAMKFWLEKGSNKISVVLSKKSNFVLGDISLEAVTELVSYKDYIGNNTQSAGDECIYTEAENVILQSDSTVIPVSEQTDPLCSPYSVMNLKINTIGASWAKHGQWLEWEIDVKETGWYNLSVRYKQNSFKGLNIKRSISIDGEIPFAEASVLSFPYTSSWRLKTVSDESGTPYSFYLEEGKHTIRMESVMGELADIIKTIDDVVYDMNAAYRSVVMITSNTADKYRDYQIEKELPELVDEIGRCADMLEECNSKVERLANGSSADSAILVTTAVQLRSMVEDPETIPYRLSSWESNIGSVSSWALSIREQPLQMDYFIFTGKDYELPKEKAGFFEKTVHSIKRFFVSFIKDYSDVDGSNDKDGVSLTVWVGTGRDQAEVLWQMTDELFTPETGIRVKVKLVSATKIEAFLSGQAPDYVYSTYQDYPLRAAKGLTMPIDKYIQEHPGQSNALMNNNCSYNGERYCVIIETPITVLYYNTALFERVGEKTPDQYLAEGNWTWATLRKVAKKLTDAQNGIYGFATDADYYFSLCMGEDVIKFEKGVAKLNLKGNQEYMDAHQILVDMINVDKSTVPTHWVAHTEFAKGTVGMAFTSLSHHTFFDNANMKTYDFTLMAKASADADYYSTVGGVNGGFGIARGSKNIEGGMAFGEQYLNTAIANGGNQTKWPKAFNLVKQYNVKKIVPWFYGFGLESLYFQDLCGWIRTGTKDINTLIEENAPLLEAKLKEYQ